MADEIEVDEETRQAFEKTSGYWSAIKAMAEEFGAAEAHAWKLAAQKYGLDPGRVYAYSMGRIVAR